jgi:hypothetical protein
MAFDAIWSRLYKLDKRQGLAMNMPTTPWPNVPCNRARSLSHHALTAFVLIIAAVIPAQITWATTFGNVYYDPNTDQLVITMSYRGTNPNHTFSLKWGRCKSGPDGSPQIFANVIDSQWDDGAQNDYQTTTRFNLGKLKCRPVNVTLRSAPRFIYQLQIPAPPASVQQ